MRHIQLTVLGIAFAATMGAATAATIAVNTAVDEFGSGASCSVREAIQTANTDADFGGCTHLGQFFPGIADTINLPTPGTVVFFTLTRIGTDDTNAAGDLDINGPVRINGDSADNSVIRGNNGDPDSDRHRLVHVISGTVTLADLTLRDGLEDGATAGGGLRTEPGTTTTLNRVVVFANTADGNAGGILNRGTMTLNGSQVTSNQTRDALNGGGGIFSSSGTTLTINDSRILNNTVKCSSSGTASGGGIYSDTGSALTLDNSVVDGNIADGRRAVDRDASGGGIQVKGALTLLQSSVTNNEAVGKTVRGGGIDVGPTPGAQLISHSVVHLNKARQSAAVGGTAQGGGIFSGSAALEIEDSVISNNQADSPDSAAGGGGLWGPFTIRRSTIINNSAIGNNSAQGGGILADTPVTVVNSTLIGNSAEGSGGGISYGATTVNGVDIYSSTIAANISGTFGGGIFLGAGANLTIANTVLAGNSATNGGPDCVGNISSQGYNLLQSVSGCGFVSGTGDRPDTPAGLAAATNNGGPTAGSSLGTISGMSTRSPLPSSLLIDAGNISGCRDQANVLLATDQIGRARAIDGPDAGPTATCDIGAVEFIDPDLIFANGFE